MRNVTAGPSCEGLERAGGMPTDPAALVPLLVRKFSFGSIHLPVADGLLGDGWTETEGRR